MKSGSRRQVWVAAVGSESRRTSEELCGKVGDGLTEEGGVSWGVRASTSPAKEWQCACRGRAADHSADIGSRGGRGRSFSEL